MRPNIHEFKENSIVYEDGQEYPCDAVVFATGYDVRPRPCAFFSANEPG